MGDESWEEVSGIAATLRVMRREITLRKWPVRMKGAATRRRRKSCVEICGESLRVMRESKYW